MRFNPGISLVRQSILLGPLGERPLLVGWLVPSHRDKGMGGRYVDFLYTICRYIATIHTDIVDKLTRSVEIVSQKNGHYFLNQHYLYKDQLYLLVRQDLLK